MRIDRRGFVYGAGAAAASLAGIYELVDRLTSPTRRQSVTQRPPEQHVLAAQRVVLDDGVEVVVPPLHHRVITALVASDHTASLARAKTALEEVLRQLDGL